MDDALLARIADALERLAPAPKPVTEGARAYRWHNGALAACDFAPLPLDLLTGIDVQKATLLDNTRRHAAGVAAHDALLWGARGSGKSALAKACAGAVDSITLVECANSETASLPELFAVLGGWARPVIVFLDDLGFDGGLAPARLVRSVLDGGSAARPANVRLYVTSNRRHIVERDIGEQESAINPRDVADDRLALADRFGLSLGFHVADQDAYVAMAEAYARALALPFDAADAIAFATGRGSRSGRVAWHYAVEVAGRAGLALDAILTPRR